MAASRRALRQRQQQLETLRASAMRAKAAADQAIGARNALIRDIDERRDLNAELAGELQTAQQKLQGALKSVGADASGDPTTLPIRPFRGSLEWPVDGTVRQRFGRGAALVNGIDIAARESSAVHAVHDGVVVFADTFAGFGRLVIVDHGRQTFTLYGNLGSVDVEKGAHISHGQTIGAVGVAPTGAAGLYFELRVDGRPVDPLQWLTKR